MVVLNVTYPSNFSSSSSLWSTSMFVFFVFSSLTHMALRRCICFRYLILNTVLIKSSINQINKLHEQQKGRKSINCSELLLTFGNFLLKTLDKCVHPRLLVKLHLGSFFETRLYAFARSCHRIFEPLLMRILNLWPPPNQALSRSELRFQAFH